LPIDWRIRVPQIPRPRDTWPQIAFMLFPGPVATKHRAFLLPGSVELRVWESLEIRQLGVLESVGSNPTALTSGMWESLEIRLPWEQEIAGSNPAIPMDLNGDLT
jgi:hypothetical protein